MLNPNNTTPLLRLARLALLRARLARCADVSSSQPLPCPHIASALRRCLATEAAAASSAPASSPSSDQAHEQYRQYEFALTPEHRRVTVRVADDAANANALVTPIVVSTSPDPERIVVRAPTANSAHGKAWSVALGPQGPEARESWSSAVARASTTPLPPLPLEVLLPARFCGLDVTTSARGGSVTVSGSGVQEADVRIVVTATSNATTSSTNKTTTTTTPTIIRATRLRCGELVLDAGAFGEVVAGEVAASVLRVRGGRGVELGRVSALDARVEAGGRLDVGAIYGRSAALRLEGSPRDDGTEQDLPLLRVNHLSCGADGDEYEEQAPPPAIGATLEATGGGKIAVRVEGALAGRCSVASGGGSVSLGAVQAAAGLRSLVVDSGGGDVDVSLDTGGSGGASRGGGTGTASTAPTAHLRLSLVGGASPSSSVDAALKMDAQGRVPVYGGGGDGSPEITIDAGGRGRVSLRVRSWMEGVMARAAEARKKSG